MTKDDDLATLDAMMRYGGSFTQALAIAALKADPQNYARLRAAFSDVWAEYQEKATWSRRRPKAGESP